MPVTVADVEDSAVSKVRETADAVATAGTDRDRQRAITALASIATQFDSLATVLDALRA